MLLIIGWLLLLFGLSAQSASAQVRLNELLPAPSSGSEWLEVMNVGTASADVSGWQLWDELTTPSLLYTFPANSLLPPGSFLTVDVNNKLNNAGDAAVLLNASGAQQDRFAYSSSSAQLSWGRFPDGIGDWQLLQTPTKLAANLANPSPSISLVVHSPSPTPTFSPTPSPFPSSLHPPILNEFQACPPTGQSEWLELANPNAEPITLTNWQLVDATGNIRLLNLLIPANGQTSVALSSAILNNTGDTLFLQTPDDISVDQTQYSSCDPNLTWQLVNGGWLQAPPTKDQPNVANNLAVTPETAASNSAVITPFAETAPAENEATLPSQGPWPRFTNTTKTSLTPQPKLSGPPIEILRPDYAFTLAALTLEVTAVALQFSAFRRWYTDWRARQKSSFFNQNFP